MVIGLIYIVHANISVLMYFFRNLDGVSDVISASGGDDILTDYLIGQVQISICLKYKIILLNEKDQVPS